LEKSSKTSVGWLVMGWNTHLMGLEEEFTI
jgi:hypothetical protein